jgi:hypothetical protein
VGSTSKAVRTVAEQGRRTLAPIEVQWDDTDADELLWRFACVEQVVIHAMRVRRLDDLVAGDSPEAEVVLGADGLAKMFGGLRGALELICERWGLPEGVMQTQSRRAGASLNAGYQRRPAVRRQGRESATVLQALASASYAVAATMAEGGKVRRVEIAPLDDETVSPEEWLAEVFGNLHGALRAAMVWWRLPLEVDTNARQAARRALRAQWRKVGAHA